MVDFDPWQVLVAVLLFGFIGLLVGKTFRLFLDERRFGSCLAGIAWVLITWFLTRIVFLAIYN